MKQKDIVNLIKFHSEGDNESFNTLSRKIANEFYTNGDVDIAKYINSLIAPISTIVPQEVEKKTIGFLDKVIINNDSFYLPDCLYKDLQGIINACKRNIGINKYIFYGSPGTGKTQAASQISRILKRNLWQVNTSKLINSYLGETAKNISRLFEDINEYPFKKTMVVLFDEIDSLSLKRNDSRDLREMDRATTELFKGLDNISKDVIVIATTNLFDDLDPALKRRFAAKINFDKYGKDDLVHIGMYYYDLYRKQANIDDKYKKLVTKILMNCNSLPSPGDLKNIMLSSIAFSDPNNSVDHVIRMFEELGYITNDFDLKSLKEMYGFTLRELELLSGVSKSEIGRRVKK